MRQRWVAATAEFAMVRDVVQSRRGSAWGGRLRVYSVGFWIRETGQAIDRLGSRAAATATATTSKSSLPLLNNTQGDLSTCGPDKKGIFSVKSISLQVYENVGQCRSTH